MSDDERSGKRICVSIAIAQYICLLRDSAPLPIAMASCAAFSPFARVASNSSSIVSRSCSSSSMERLPTGLLEDAIDDCLLDLGGKFGDRPEVFPPGRDRAGEVIHEMLNAALNTTEVKQQIGSHYAPTQSRSQAHSSIGISDIQHTLLDEVYDLPIQRALDTVRDMADHFFSNMNGLLTDRCVKRECLLHGFC